MREPERLEGRRAALIAYDVCRRALTPSDNARRAAMRPVLDAWVRMIAAARAAGVPVIYTTLFRSSLETLFDAVSLGVAEVRSPPDAVDRWGCLEGRLWGQIRSMVRTRARL